MFTISFPKLFVCQAINAAAQQRYKLYNTKNKYNEKSAQRRRKHCALV